MISLSQTLHFITKKIETILGAGKIYLITIGYPVVICQVKHTISWGQPSPLKRVTVHNLFKDRFEMNPSPLSSVHPKQL